MTNGRRNVRWNLFIRFSSNSMEGEMTETTGTYRTLRRRAKTASTILERAEGHLLDTCSDDMDYADERAVMDARDVFAAANKRLWTEVDAARKREHIGVYTPYGRRSVPFNRR